MFPSSSLQQCLQDLVSGLPTDLPQLEAALQQTAAFAVNSATVREAVRERSQLLQDLYPKFESFCRNRLGWQTCPLDLLWRLWLPLALQLAAQQRMSGNLLVQGILGGQGTGKTTLAAILTLILNHLGHRVCSLSLDDLYKTYGDRRQLQQADPRLRWRGPPGTHDIELGLSVFQQLRDCSGHPVPLPRFDKSAYQGAGDRTDPEWVTDVEIVLFEGWFVGVRPIDPRRFETAPPPICTTADRAFARNCNARLQAYLPLWQQLDQLIVLAPVDYRLSQQWRQQAEQQMRATGRSGMTDLEIDEFVEYFWRSLHPELFIQPLLHRGKDNGANDHPANAVDLIIEICPDHRPGAVYRPANL